RPPLLVLLRENTSLHPVSDFIWQPSPDRLERANLTRLYRRLGVNGYQELHGVSIEEPDRFWRAVVDDLGLGLEWDRVNDGFQWFVGATTNIARACVHAWAARDGEALVGRYEDGTREAVTW